MVIYVYSLIGLAVLFLAGGIFFIVRGMREDTSDDVAVPISSLDEIRNFKKAFTSSVQPAGSNVQLTQHILNENLGSSVAVQGGSSGGSLTAAGATGVGAGMELEENSYSGEKVPSESKVEALEKECQRLKDALEREISSKDLTVLAKDEKSRIEELNRNLVRSQATVESLTEENQTLKSRLIQQENAYQSLAQSLQQFKDQHDKMLAENQQVIAKISERAESAEQLIQSASVRGQTDLEKLTQENQEFRRALMEAKEAERQIRLAGERDRTRAEQLEGQLRELRMDLENRKVSSEQDQASRILQLQKAVQQMEIEKAEISKRHMQLQADYNRINTMNGQLIEKGKILQYELTKHRAQALGLEKICEDFRWQMERGSGSDSKVSAA